VELKSVHSLIKVLSSHLPGDTEKNHEDPKSGYQVSWLIHTEHPVNAYLEHVTGPAFLVV
jgi:hypothetical protein